MKRQAQLVTFLALRRVAYNAEFVAQCLRKHGCWVAGDAHSPHAVVTHIQSTAEGLGRQRDVDRTAQTQKAVEEGFKLLEARQFAATVPWSETLERSGTSASSARNKIALALWSERCPAMYRALMRLGPTKLYRVARLTDEELKRLDFDERVQTRGGPRPVHRLDSRGLMAHLRRKFGPRARPRSERLKAAIEGVARLIETASGRNQLGDCRDLQTRLRRTQELLAARASGKEVI